MIKMVFLKYILLVTNKLIYDQNNTIFDKW